MTTARVLELAPTAKSMAALGLEVGVCRERVRQILRDAGNDGFRHPRKPCPDCGVPAEKGKSGYRCPTCRRKRAVTRWFAKRIGLCCETCGHWFWRRRVLHAINLKRGQRHIWCKRSCQGMWLAQIRWGKKEDGCQIS